MVYRTAGNGNTALTHFQAQAAMVLSATPMAMACPTCRNTPTSNLAVGICQAPVVCSTMVFGGTGLSRSTTGMKKTLCSTTDPGVVTLVTMVLVQSFCVTKIPLATSVPTASMTTKMVLSIQQILTTMVTQIVHQTTMTAMELKTKM